MQSCLAVTGKRSFLYELLIRIFTAYFFVLIEPFPLGYIPFVHFLKKGYDHIFDVLVSWTGYHIFHISFPLVSTANGSGDTTFDYLYWFLSVLITVVIVIVWSIADRERKYDARILYWVTAYVRFYFAVTMMKYGLEKVIKAQFPFPFYSLNETYGDSSPMRLMWSFMGYSNVYNFVIGITEVSAGFLVLFRKTTTLGALLSVAILSNVVVLNFCFDVPVKLFALNFLLMAIYIAAPDMKRLADFFLLNKAIPAIPILPRFRKKQVSNIWFAVKSALTFYILYSSIQLFLLKYSTYGDGAFKTTPLFGIYNTETFVKNDDTLLPLLTDTSQWKMLNIVYKKKATIKFMNDAMKDCRFITDTTHKTIRVNDIEDTTYKASFSYSIPDSTHLLLKGKLKEDSVVILMAKQDMNKYRLLNRGFHWINEAPYNR